MLRIDNAGELSSHLTPKRVEYVEISARRKGLEVPPQVTFAIETTLAIRLRGEEGLDVRLKITSSGDFFDAATDVAVLFDFTETLEVSEEAQHAFLTGRGFELAYPYAKEAFEQAIARIGFPALLPLQLTLSHEPGHATQA